MYVGYLAVVFLTGFAGVLHAQRAEKPCSAPTLENGYVVPDEDTYPHDTKVSYACEDGHKPATEGWWATTTCENGLWSPVPQCIDAKLCFPPNVPNGKYKETQSGWYDPGTLRVTCDKGYKFKDLVAVAKCENGLWSSVPTCEKSSHTCGEPPKVPHAVIINQKYQELFAVDFKLQYECEDGYTVEGGEDSKSIFCISGRWTEGPTCRQKTEVGRGGSTVGGTGGHTTSGGSGSQPVDGGSSTRSGSETEHQKTTIIFCGKHPHVHNGAIVETRQMFLKYQCNSFYTLMGPEKVECYTNGEWSEIPTCKATYCLLDTYARPELVPVGEKYLKHGETKVFDCVKDPKWWFDHSSVATCTDGTLTLTVCCNGAERTFGRCKNA